MAAAPAWPTPPPPPLPRRRVSLIIGAAVVVVLLGFAGLGFRIFKGMEKAQAETRAAAGPTNSFPAHEQDLSHYAIAVSAGSKPWRDKATNEPLDLTAAVADGYPSNKATGRALLTRYHFRSGFVRRWVAADLSIDKVKLLQFDSPDSARDFFTFYVAANSDSTWGKDSAVPGIAGGESFVQSTVTNDDYQAALSVADAGDVVAIVIATQPAPAGAQDANDILTAQYAALR
jgi:hypothetical protein